LQCHVALGGGDARRLGIWGAQFYGRRWAQSPSLGRGGFDGLDLVMLTLQSAGITT